MHILILAESFPPETKSASTLFSELAESLVKKGHRVKVITRMPKFNVASGTNMALIPSSEIISGVTVYRYNTPPLPRNIPFIRGFEHFILGLIFFWGALKLSNLDAILVYSPPLPLGISGYWLGRIKNCPLVVNIQDLYPQTVIDLGLLKNKFLIWVSKKMELFVYRRSDILTVHSEGNKNYVIANGATADKVRIVHNWVDTELIKPGPKTNEFSAKFNLNNKFIVSFAGVIGFAQGLDIVIKAAELLKENKEIMFIIVGDGVKRHDLEEQVKNLRLGNVTFLPTQPLKIYPKILDSSDLCLVTLSPALLTPAVPGKLLSILASGKPIIACVPSIGDTPKIINELQCGITVEPADVTGFAKAVIRLYNDQGLRMKMGSNGRKAAENIFSRQMAISKYDDIFRNLEKNSNVKNV